MTRTGTATLALSLLAGTALGVGLVNTITGRRRPRARDRRRAAGAKTSYRLMRVGDLDIFYREAGPKDAPTVLLLHGFPSSSHMFRDLIPALADRYHVIAPDYPGFGNSAMPSRSTFQYTFDRLAGVIDDFTEALGLDSYALYVQDYGAPIGFRLASAHPERITAIVVQNGNAYDEGIDNEFWKPLEAYWDDPTSRRKRDGLRGMLGYDATRWQYTVGVKDLERVSPDGPAVDQFFLDREGNDEIQLDLLLDYGNNPPLYPTWQAYFRVHQPPMLVVWGKNDPIFPPAGAKAYRRDLENVEVCLLDAAHFALETEVDTIAARMREFLARNVTATGARKMPKRRVFAAGRFRGEVARPAP